MLESKVEYAVTRYAKYKGCQHFKFVSPGNKFVPDRIITYKGNVLFVEFKAAGKLPSKGQVKVISKMRQSGTNVVVIDSVAGGKEVIDKFILLPTAEQILKLFK